MNANKKLLITQIILMYLAHIPFYLAFILIQIFKHDASYDNIIIGLLLAGIVTSILILPICLANGIMSLLSLLKDFNSPIKLTLKLKIILIPWYIFNFIVCILLIAGFLNPWLLIAVPIIVCILVGITYIFMLTTSLQAICYTIRKLSKKEETVRPIIIIGIVFLFCFCLDLIGALLLRIAIKDNKEMIKE